MEMYLTRPNFTFTPDRMVVLSGNSAFIRAEAYRDKAGRSFVWHDGCDPPECFVLMKFSTSGITVGIPPCLRKVLVRIGEGFPRNNDLLLFNDHAFFDGKEYSVNVYDGWDHALLDECEYYFSYYLIEEEEDPCNIMAFAEADYYDLNGRSIEAHICEPYSGKGDVEPDKVVTLGTVSHNVGKRSITNMWRLTGDEIEGVHGMSIEYCSIGRQVYLCTTYHCDQGERGCFRLSVFNTIPNAEHLFGY